MSKGFVSTAYMIIAGLIVLTVLLLLLAFLETSISDGIDWLLSLIGLV